VALALVGTIVTIVYGSFATTSRSVDLYQSRMACSDRASLVLRLMARQFRCAYLPALGTDPATAAPRDSNSPRAAVVSPPAAIETDGAIVSFVTTAGPGSGTDPSLALARVLYRFDPAAETLSLAYEPYVSGAHPLEEAPTWRPLLTGVKSFEVQFYDGRQWQSGSAGASRQTLPQAVKIALSLVDQRNRSHEWGTMAALGCHVTVPKPQVITPVPKL
jgi:type II secretory pathway component PulJ